MKRLNLKPAESCYEAVLTFGLRGIRVLLILTCWALSLVSLLASGLADMAGRSAARIRVQ
jgi:hypothetical protein